MHNLNPMHSYAEGGVPIKLELEISMKERKGKAQRKTSSFCDQLIKLLLIFPVHLFVRTEVVSGKLKIRIVEVANELIKFS